MKKSIFLITLTFSFIAFLSFSYPQKKLAGVPYPEGYREWTHVKTAIIGPQNPHFSTYGGFHHIYANEKAMVGYTTGNFPEGSVIVFDVLEALVQKDSNIEEGKRRHVDVMMKDSVLYSSTGGWGYEQFVENSKTERNKRLTLQTDCFDCHSNQKNFVFSSYRK